MRGVNGGGRARAFPACMAARDGSRANTTTVRAYTDFEACVAANQTLDPVVFDFDGGMLGIWLDDSNYADNLPGETAATRSGSSRASAAAYHPSNEPICEQPHREPHVAPRGLQQRKRRAAPRIGA